MTKADVERAIGIVEESRRTHVEWAEFLATAPEFTTDVVGDAAFHQECVGGYDHVLAVLRVSLLERGGSDAAG